MPCYKSWAPSFLKRGRGGIARINVRSHLPRESMKSTAILQTFLLAKSILSGETAPCYLQHSSSCDLFSVLFRSLKWRNLRSIVMEQTTINPFWADMIWLTRERTFCVPIWWSEGDCQSLANHPIQRKTRKSLPSRQCCAQWSKQISAIPDRLKIGKVNKLPRVGDTCKPCMQRSAHSWWPWSAERLISRVYIIVSRREALASNAWAQNRGKLKPW